ncbi:hypothetical protein WA1_13315 [Scytonema hofmannii PCC 7110]|uniref:Nitrile hydratase alpha /Thiocyanate hydrolase gamma domain-containing protein n=1 Tax=Scytonema hofmannii PCC 7110 TaxID=128403 RepID=A0A139XEG3_9CYAN|nr:NHLP leader peptide family RiPP precursor [Scytonema hofmannii]KYC43075.1 hypothetical protein WA1_13315 [Scytonema hofmannii PCC 7110]
MTTNFEEFNSQTLEERIIVKAIEDPNYKQRLLSDAKAVVEEELGDKLGEDVTIQVLQQSAKHLYLLLPVDIDDMIREGLITQEELEAVAGGSARLIKVTKALHNSVNAKSKSDVSQGVSGVVATVTSLASALYSAVRSRKG